MLSPGTGRDEGAGEHWFDRQKEQAAAGAIEITVPRAAVERPEEGAWGRAA